MERTAVATVEHAPVGSVDTLAGKYLVFHLGREDFGIRVLKVREIMGVQDITARASDAGSC